MAVLIGTALGIAYFVGRMNGHTEGRQSVESVACEPKCEFVYRNKKLINVTCPDSLGVMP